MFRSLILAAALASPAVAQAPQIHAGGWARATVSARAGSALYLLIHNAGPGPDRLLAVTTPAAAKATLHASNSGGGVMRMRPLPSLAIGADQAVEMRPGGIHVMLTGLKAPLRAGEKLPVTLRFERAGIVETRVRVRSFAEAVRDQHRH